MSKTPEQYAAEQEQKRKKRAEYARTWRILNPEKAAAIEAKRKPKDPEKTRAYLRDYYAANKEKYLRYSKTRMQDPDARAARRKWEAEQRAADPEKYAARQREWRAANKERDRTNSQKWREENRDRVNLAASLRREQQKAAGQQTNAQKWTSRNPYWWTVKGCYDRAAKGGYEADKEAMLALEILTHCPVLGTEITFQRGTGQRSSRNVASIDKIAPERGYVAGNMQIMSKAANTAKSDLTPEELLKFADWIYRTYGKQDVPATAPG